MLRPMRALILEQGDVRGAVAAARALAADGWTVGSGAPVAHPLSGHSRAVTRQHRVPPISAGASALMAGVNQAIADGGYEVVFSCDDIGLFLLSQHRSELHATFPYGDHAGVVRALDKLNLMREARSAGLAVPQTELAGTSELKSLCQWPGPIVVKPRFTFVEGIEERVSACVAPDIASATASIHAMREAGAEPLVQEHLSGQLTAFTALTDRNAQIVAQTQQVADRIWPPGAGVSARAHTVAVDEQLAASVGRLLEGLGWFGLANLQFILCEDGVPRLLDFNGRFYGSLALAVAAGPNLPAVWARLATGQPVRTVQQSRPGVRYQWLAGDLRAGCVATSGVARVTALIDTLVCAAGATHGTWRASDPWPAITHYSRKLAKWMRQRS
jgi:predicted ATP-grasp superfamily ATP-dependent carboligase